MSLIARSSGVKKPPAWRGTSSKLRAMRFSAATAGVARRAATPRIARHPAVEGWTRPRRLRLAAPSEGRP